ncbi:hypothetical protein OH769_14600 [[Kitasatospora] papulosa]|uniref:hypothetical protein n=1 Tax=Streptomyces TaxID=1883 RepID=UPI000BCCAB13|nr:MULTISPECIES: hypothetical protein [Streptomyces]MYT57609.1 hypothetical protein [Streptomyces sp. SID7834]RAS30043.1 hypothetical protein BCL80_106164 [Streptomyces avidinii]WSK29017.1 hypothetical protein OG483_14540 [[Kitasatospora] papulosa]SNX77766.1 hypothetical protein SAMN05421860_105167 [Streptomyces microflavus]
MSENHSTGPMRWDEHARGGAGGWVHASDAGTEHSGGPAPEPSPGPGDGRPSLPRKYLLLAVGGGLVVAAVILTVAHVLRPSPSESGHAAGSSPSGSPSRALTGSSASESEPSDPPAASGEEQAAAVDALLERSEADRQQVVDAVNAVEACASDDSVDTAGQTLADAAVRREELITDLSALDVGALPSGSRATDSLRTGWQHSADADRAFADWADDAQGCSPGAVPHTPSYDKGVRSSELATGSKEEFLTLWKPIAMDHGLPERDTAEL